MQLAQQASPVNWLQLASKVKLCSWCRKYFLDETTARAVLVSRRSRLALKANIHAQTSW